jgi:4-hydroxy-3-polyprenylbenzoate decarboxylase
MSDRDIIVGVTGASGAVYAQALVRELLAQGLTVHFIPSAHAAVSWQCELNGGDDSALTESETDAPRGWEAWLDVPADAPGRLAIYGDERIDAPPASGTFRARAMVVVPCSMNTLAKIAGGIGDTLLTRAAAVSLKERRPLVLVPRETPISLIDLRNMTAAAEAGAVVLPASPGFYHRPTAVAHLVHFVVSKICDQIGLFLASSVRYDQIAPPQ